MPYDFILALDPSGSYTEGKGTTGWCVFDTKGKKLTLGGFLTATSYDKMEIYWHAHLDLIQEYYKRYGKRMIIVIEDYLLYATKAQDQINSKMETPKLIGILQHYCWLKQIPYHMQTASEVKTRWTDEILEHKGYIKHKGRNCIVPESGDILNKHSRDSVRHAVHYATFKNKEA